ncbi:hypothetical protein J8N05_18690 [Streptomyces sp. BH-SS-21]|uniref:Uncharacterized protein n=1 Tax=Streptomyces liliiviolaceus TaxID=2823109 RepID=A0A941B4D1_9ACTN|nr:hypothetical protein [Streptomyces liliiviolaceus]
MWVAVFTGGTAVLASWVTTVGNARAARVQAETSIEGQRRDHLRSSRRIAYLDLMEQAHVIGELYWRVGDAYVQLTDHAARLTRIEETRVQLRDGFDPLMRCVRVIVLEGSDTVAQAARAVLEAAAEANSALWHVSLEKPQAREDFDEAQERFRDRLDEFISAAHTAVSTL